MEDHGRTEQARSDHGRTELELEELHPDQNGRLPGSWLCCIPCYWLKRNNGVEKALLTVATLLVTVLLVASPVLFLISSVPGDRGNTCSHKDCRSDGKGECLQEECLDAARRVSEAMSWGRDPCQDFYQFACGAVAGRTSSERMTTEHKEAEGSYKAMQKLVMLNLLERLTSSTANSEPFQKLGSFFKSCLRARDQEERISSTPMLALLRELGGYLPPGAPVPRDLTGLVLRLLRINGAPLFQIQLERDFRNYSKYAPYIDIPRDFLFKTTGLQRYELSESIQQTSLPMTGSERRQSREFALVVATLEEERLLKMEKILLEMLPENMTAPLRTTEMQVTLHFASTLTKLYPAARLKMSWMEAREKATTIAELQQNYPFMQWKTLFDQAFHAEYSLLDTIYLLCPQYLESIGKMIPRFEERIIHNGLLVIYAVDALFPLVNPSIHGRWPLFCTQLTIDLFKKPVSALYVNQFSPEQLDQLRMRMNLIFEAVKRSLEARLRTVTWVDEPSRTAVLNKLEHLHGQFLSSPNFRNASYVSTLLENVRVDPKDFFGNVIRRYGQMSLQPITTQDQKLDAPSGIPPFVVNGFYHPPTNTMIIPLAVLVQPHFYADVPQYIPYATVGKLIAHEILHAFDLENSYNGQGELEPLLTPATTQKLEKKLDCIVSQFSDSFLKSKSLGKSVVVHFNWNITRNENMADINGIEVAFQTWASEVDTAKEPTLPGLPFTSNQLFFLFAAQTYCANLPPVEYMIKAERDEHAPDPERVNGMMMNSPAFAAAFKCRLGSHMNPKRKCTVW